MTAQEVLWIQNSRRTVPSSRGSSKNISVPVSLDDFGRTMSFKIPHNYSAILSANYHEHETDKFSLIGVLVHINPRLLVLCSRCKKAKTVWDLYWAWIVWRLSKTVHLAFSGCIQPTPASKVPLRLNAAQMATPFSKYSSIASGSSTLWNGSTNGVSKEWTQAPTIPRT